MTAILTLDTDTVDAVQQVTKAALDGSAIYREASRIVSEPGLAGRFKRLARERMRMVIDLQRVLEACDEQPARNGTLTGVVHRLWADLRGAVNAGDPRVMLLELVRAENRLADLYRDALARTAGEPVHDCLARHYRQVKSDIGRLGRLHDER